MKNCKVIPEESVGSQHKLIVMNMKFMSWNRREAQKGSRMYYKCWKLRGKEEEQKNNTMGTTNNQTEQKCRGYVESSGNDYQEDRNRIIRGFKTKRESKGKRSRVVERESSRKIHVHDNELVLVSYTFPWYYFTALYFSQFSSRHSQIVTDFPTMLL